MCACGIAVFADLVIPIEVIMAFGIECKSIMLREDSRVSRGMQCGCTARNLKWLIMTERLFAMNSLENMTMITPA